MNIKEQGNKLKKLFPEAENIEFNKRYKLWEVAFDGYDEEIIKTYLFEGNSFRLLGTTTIEM